jgi:hypothetical protein
VPLRPQGRSGFFIDPPTDREHLNPTKLAGIILIVLGCIGLAYGGFSYTKDTTALKVGSFEVKVQEKETLSVPLIVSAAGIALGAFLLFGFKSK